MYDLEILSNLNIRKVLKSNVLKMGRGPIFIVKAGLTGVSVRKPLKLGPLLIRPYDNRDTYLDVSAWPHKCVVELTFRDATHTSPQETPISIYVTPMYLLLGIYRAIQIIADGWVGLSMLHCFNSHGKEVTTAGSHLTQIADSFHERRPLLTKKDAPRLLKTLTAMKKADNRFFVASIRFNKACTELMDESILNFIISIEGLLSPGDTELAHRVSCRTAIILGKSRKERRNYYAVMKYFYDARSSLVHGSTHEIKDPKASALSTLSCFGIKIGSGATKIDKYEVANLLRSINQKLLLFFIDNPNKLNDDWLLNLEINTL